MYESILVPLDGSALSQAVLPLVRTLAKSLDSRIVLLHALETAVEPSSAEARARIASAVPDARRGAQRYLDDIATRLRDEGLSVETVVVEGRAPQQIVEYAEGEQLKLIAMATHGRSGIARAVLGSVASRILQVCTCPLLLVRPRQEADLWVGPDQLQRVLVPLDGSPTAEAALPYAQELAKRLNAPLTLIQVLPRAELLAADPYAMSLWRIPWEEIQRIEAEAQSYLAALGQELVAQGIKTTWEVLQGRAAQSIVDYARGDTGTLMVMTTHGRSGLQRWALGSVTDEVVRETGAPVLVIRTSGAERGKHD